MAGKYHVRSVSFPSSSHPSTNAVEQELNRVRTWEASSTTSTSGSIRTGLSGLDNLHRCADDLVKMASTQQVLSRPQNHSFVDGLLDGSLRVLDACNIIRDVVSQTKEHSRVLQSAIRRRKGDSSVQQGISSYVSFRKKMKKEAKMLKLSLNQIENKDFELVGLQDAHLSSVLRVLAEVNATNVSVFQTVSAFLASPMLKKRQSKWLVISKLMHKGKVGIQETVNEIEAVDSALSKFGSCGEETNAQMTENVQKSLEALEIEMEGIESCLECVFRRLIKTRASLLNTISN